MQFNLAYVDIREKIPFSKTQLKNWINALLRANNARCSCLNYIFCSDDYLLNINQLYLKHNDYTDVITFNHTNPFDKGIVADVYISLQRVKENSVQFCSTFEKELLRVMAHGLLHACGWNDKSEKERIQMRLKEEESIDMWMQIQANTHNTQIKF